MLKAEAFETFLQKELVRRQSKNPSYSLRAFARDLEVSAGYLSDILKGRYCLSRDGAQKLAKKLNLSKEEESVLIESTRIAQNKKKSNRLGARLQRRFSERLPDDQFKQISDWYHYAILELFYLKSFKEDPRWIGHYLGISIGEASQALDRLERLKLLKRAPSGRLTLSNDWTTTSEDIPSDALKNHNGQILEKAKKALYSQPVEKRDISSTTLAISRTRIPEAKRMIREFKNKFEDTFGKSRSKNAVYCLSTLFFELGEEGKL
jgi:uncharacterized protein (TIGR02147 family)